ncbi:unnamed protein product [Mesocestoides corti]|uniref:SCP domain-containing protein n=1 Tax=Mesocestoides corti TaxID=53468 RepID=A0A0R3UB56_MESCO|nr:unnamed protein product [Mesocestoides corti]
MEQLAIEWVNRCEYRHPNRTGQNLATAGGFTPNLTQMAEGWYSEFRDYNYTNKSCSNVCGHYTQMVWATTVGLGCAMKQCDDIRPGWPKPIYLMGCHYEPV